MTSPDYNTIVSRDAGGFYCEHAFFGAQVAVRRAGCAGATDGPARVGFLHVPDRPALVAAPETLDLVARALAAWGQHATAANPVLVTGFGPFGDIAVNPSGAFVGDEAVASRMNDSAPCHRAVLDVDDAGLSRLMSLIRDLQPAAVLMLGVARGTRDAFRVEAAATDRNLRWATASGGALPLAHDPGAAVRLSLRPNFALATVLGLRL